MVCGGKNEFDQRTAFIKHHRVTLVPRCSLGSGSGSDQVVIHKDRVEPEVTQTEVTVL